jgi:paraquat-inducible protein B
VVERYSAQVEEVGDAEIRRKREGGYLMSAVGWILLVVFVLLVIGAVLMAYSYTRRGRF